MEISSILQLNIFTIFSCVFICRKNKLKVVLGGKNLLIGGKRMGLLTFLLKRKWIVGLLAVFIVIIGLFATTRLDQE